jgi:hypothetical protein
MKQKRYVFRPPTTGPWRASPVHSSFGRPASNRPNACCCPGTAGTRYSSSRSNSRCSVRSEGDHPDCARRMRRTCAAVRSGFSCFSAAARASTCSGVRAVTCRGAGTRASNPAAR